MSHPHKAYIEGYDYYMMLPGGLNYLFHNLWFLSNLLGIEGSFDGPGAKTVIPRKVNGKFSIRIVPDMTPDEVEKKVREHLEKVHKDRGSPNPMK